MENHNHRNNDSDGHFYKGFFFGLIIGVGIVWFLGSETGKGLVRAARKKIDETLPAEPGMEDYEEEVSTSSTPEVESESTFSAKPRKFFHKRSE